MKKILFLGGGVLLAYGLWCWYKQEKKPAQSAGTATGGVAKEPEKTAPAHQSSELIVQEPRQQAELVITEEPLQAPPLDKAIHVYDTNPGALFYRPRTTIEVGPEVAQNVVTIDSANMYAR